jgi:spore coat protein U-like protein
MKRLAFLSLLLFFGVRLGAQTCQINGTTGVYFGTYSSVTIQTTGAINVTCTKGTAYSLGINAGSTSGATVTNRMLYCSGCTPAKLGYGLFIDAGYTQNWGSPTNGIMASETGTGSAQSITVYAKLPGAEAYYAGSNGANYADVVVVTLVCSSCKTISGSPQNLNLNVAGTAEGCGISATALSFGNYSGTAVQGTATINVGCGSTGHAYTVGLNAGTATGATVTTRAMTGTSAVLNYSLYSNSGMTTNWGNTSGSWVSRTSNGANQPLTVYGQIPAGQYVASGTYADTITATITY